MSGNNGEDTVLNAVKAILRRYQANSLSYLRAKKELQDEGLSLKEVEKLLEAIEYEDVDELVEDDDEEVDD